jgi:hypothetical protein
VALGAGMRAMHHAKYSFCATFCVIALAVPCLIPVGT